MRIVLLRHALDFFLTFQVKGASGSSHKAVGRLQHHFSASTPGARSNRTALYAVTLSQRNDFLAL
jgi:hypothetical protein